MQPGPQDAIVARIVSEPAADISAADVLIQAIGLTGVLLLASALLGALLGGLFIGIRILRPLNSFNGDSSDDCRLRLDSLPR